MQHYLPVDYKLASSIAIVIATFLFIKFYWRHTRNQKRKAYPKDVVILHQLPSHKKVPNMSPFCLKLETW